MIHGRTTESPSAKPWDCCYVSAFTPLHSSPKLLTLFRMSLWCTINAFGLFPNPDHILEHSEDDTKSLFVIIKVSSLFDFSITHVWNVIILPCGRPAKVSQCPLSVCLSGPSVWRQIISDLMFFRGTHKKEFESRWKSFTLVKKSMENRVS